MWRSRDTPTNMTWLGFWCDRRYLGEGPLGYGSDVNVHFFLKSLGVRPREARVRSTMIRSRGCIVSKY